MLHTGRLRSHEAKHPKAVQLLQRLRAQNLLYETPNGSNDDWYWIYASVSAGGAMALWGHASQLCMTIADQPISLTSK